jgi:hypothetical protein
LIFTEEDWSLVLANGLVVLGEPALVPLEVNERVLSTIERSIDGQLALVFVETCLIEDVVHQDVVV